jgi:hypothetical protein
VVCHSVVHVIAVGSARELEVGGSRSSQLDVISIEHTRAAIRMQLRNIVGQQNSDLRLGVEAGVRQELGIAGLRPANNVDCSDVGILYERQLQRGSAGLAGNYEAMECIRGNSTPSRSSGAGVGGKAAGPAALRELRTVLSGAGSRSGGAAAAGIGRVNGAAVSG